MNSWVLLLGVCLSGLGLVPIKNTTNERRNQVCASLGTSDGLNLRKEESKVAVDFVVALEDTGGLDTFPGGGDLDQNAGFVDANGLVKLQIPVSMLLQHLGLC